MLLTFLLLALLVLLGSWFAYSIAFFSPKSRHASIEDPLKGEQYDAVAEHISRVSHIMQKYPYEEVGIESFDGKRLFGRYYHVKDGAPVEILFHGYRSHAFRDCSGGHALSRKIGINTLVIDQRGQGSSEGTPSPSAFWSAGTVCPGSTTSAGVLAAMYPSFYPVCPWELPPF